MAARHCEGDAAAGEAMSAAPLAVEGHALRATLMRGGTSKGVFFAADDLPAGLLQRPSERDALLLHVIGSPMGFFRPQRPTTPRRRW